jgi:hypothetical protein
MELWIGCVAGALRDHQYIAKLAEAAFDTIGIEQTRVYFRRPRADVSCW